MKKVFDEMIALIPMVYIKRQWKRVAPTRKYVSFIVYNILPDKMKRKIKMYILQLIRTKNQPRIQCVLA
jgi:hypothetical protein